MKVTKRTVTVIQMTPEEVQQFEDMIHEAATGRTVNYSERQTGPNQFFGISISPRHVGQCGNGRHSDPVATV